MFVRDGQIERTIMRQRRRTEDNKRDVSPRSFISNSFSTLLLMKLLGETSLLFVPCSSSLSHDHSLWDITGMSVKWIVKAGLFILFLQLQCFLLSVSTSLCFLFFSLPFSIFSTELLDHLKTWKILLDLNKQCLKIIATFYEGGHFRSENPEIVSLSLSLSSSLPFSSSSFFLSFSKRCKPFLLTNELLPDSFFSSLLCHSSHQADQNRDFVSSGLGKWRAVIQKVDNEVKMKRIDRGESALPQF